MQCIIEVALLNNMKIPNIFALVFYIIITISITYVSCWLIPIKVDWKNI